MRSTAGLPLAGAQRGEDVKRRQFAKRQSRTGSIPSVTANGLHSAKPTRQRIRKWEGMNTMVKFQTSLLHNISGRTSGG
ncbi:hypothetical protein [Paenibacillus xylaniclasticus]|uniref:hypothetical protein n=1 Tax=Paenibacillus xylaniclasticus TaxID=588083 RepID=UPI000FD7FF54|nr:MULTISPECIES: hypothetical protein [Paenibacillus]